MIKVISKEMPPIGANSHIVLDTESKNTLIIDLGGGFQYLLRYIESLGYTLKGVLLTHGHFDHVAGAIECKNFGVPVWIEEKDAPKLTGSGNVADFFGYDFENFAPDFTFKGGQTLNIGSFEIKTFLTPGHSEGSACFLIEDNLFSGDVIFKCSYGRTDFEDGSYPKLKQSIQKLFELDGNLKVYSGHGEPTTIEYERKYNPINYDYGY